MNWRSLPWPVLALMILAGVGMAVLVGGGGNEAALEVASRAQGCPIDQLQIVDHPNRYHVRIRGCGQTCTYSVGVGSAMQKGCE